MLCQQNMFITKNLLYPLLRSAVSKSAKSSLSQNLYRACSEPALACCVNTWANIRARLFTFPLTIIEPAGSVVVMSFMRQRIDFFP